MKHIEVFNRAWETVWSYRALWAFGTILALVTFSWPAAAVLDRDQDWTDQGIQITVLDGETFWDAFQRTKRQQVDEANRELSELLTKELGIDVEPDVRIVAATLIGLTIVAFLVAKVAGYVSETALIRMVGTYVDRSERLGVRRGLRLGWSRSALRLFLVNLIINGLGIVATLLLFAVILAPLPLWVDSSEGVVFTFALLTGGLFFVAIFAVIIASAALSAWKRLSRQACALEGLTAVEAVRRGWRILLRHPKDAGWTWAITWGVRLGWAAAVVPLVLLLVGVGLLISGLPAVSAGGLVGLATTGDTPIFVGLALGVPIFLLVLIAPLVLLSGLRETVVSTLWTLTYRELDSLEGVEPAHIPVVGASGLEAAPSA